LRWRQNATSRIKSLGGGTRKTGPSLLARGVLPFLALPLRILRHHCLCRSSRLITNIRRLNLFLVLQRPLCSPSQIPIAPIILFVLDSSCLQLSSTSDVGLWIVTPFATHTQRMREEAVKEEEPSASRGNDGVGRHGRPLFVLGWQGSSEERMISDAYVRCVLRG
jgi:hypothetical protein